MSLTECLVTAGPAISLDSGAPGEPGQKVKVDLEIPHNARLVRDGRLVAITETKPPTKAELEKRAKELEIEGRSTMNAEELAAAISAAEAAAIEAEKENS